MNRRILEAIGITAAVALISAVATLTLERHRRLDAEAKERFAADVRRSKTHAAVELSFTQFFKALNEKRYADAVELYDGSYDTLQSWNPTVEPSDHAALWKNGCEQNGLKCLKIEALEVWDSPVTGTYVVNAWFVGANGEGLTVAEHPSSGADGVESRRNVFPFTVAKSADGAFRVQSLPVYSP